MSRTSVASATPRTRPTRATPSSPGAPTPPSSCARRLSSRSARWRRRASRCHRSRPSSTRRSPPGWSSTHSIEDERRQARALVPSQAGRDSGHGDLKIYTRKGDDGTTGLWYGGRVPKAGGRPEAYGAVDEAASALGMCRAACGSNDEEVHRDILRIQEELFVLGAELATAPEAAHRLEPGVSKVTQEMIDRLEQDIDRYMERVNLPPKFVI